MNQNLKCVLYVNHRKNLTAIPCTPKKMITGSTVQVGSCDYAYIPGLRIDYNNA